MTLFLNRPEMAVSVLRAVVDMELDLDRNVGQVLVDSCVTLVDSFVTLVDRFCSWPYIET